MVKVFLTSIFFIGISRTGLGSPVLTCNDVDLTSISTIQCSCYNPGGNGIDWYNAGTYLTQCTLSNKQCFPFDGYTFVVNSSTFTYTMEFGSYSYTNCSSVSCNDITTTSDSELKTISVDESSLNQTIPVINEPPANHTNGNISFTTNCLYKARSTDINVTAKWTALIVTGGEIDLEVDETISKTGSCQCCSYDFASKFSIEFYHEEEQSDQKEKAHIRIELLLDGKPASPPLRRTTNNIYYVRGKNNVTITTNSTTQSAPAIIFITTTSGRHGIPSSISSISVPNNSTFVNSVSDTRTKSVPSDVVLYIALSCFVVTFLLVVFCYALCLYRS